MSLRRLLGIASLLCVLLVSANCVTTKRAVKAMDTGAPDHISKGRSMINSLISKGELAFLVVEGKCTSVPPLIDLATCAEVRRIHKAGKVGIEVLNTLLQRWALAGTKDADAKAAFQDEYMTQARGLKDDIDRLHNVRDSAMSGDVPAVVE